MKKTRKMNGLRTALVAATFVGTGLLSSCGRPERSIDTVVVEAQPAPVKGILRYYGTERFHLGRNGLLIGGYGTIEYLKLELADGTTKMFTMTSADAPRSLPLNREYTVFPEKKQNPKGGSVEISNYRLSLIGD